MLVISFILLFYSFVFPQKESDLKIFKQRTLLEVTLFNRENTDDILKRTKLEDKTDFIGVDLFHSRARVQFIGNPRIISASHQEVIKIWRKLQHIDEKAVSFYEKEFLFKECDKEYWIPVPKKVGESLEKNLKSGEMVTLFVIHLGGRKEPNVKDFEWIFLANGFEK